MGKIDENKLISNCAQHSKLKTWECDTCRKQMCDDCKPIGFQHKIYCSTCIEKTDSGEGRKIAHPAGAIKKLSAFSIDIIVLIIINLVFVITAIFFFTPHLAVILTSISYIIYVTYFTLFTSLIGQTPGKMAIEIEVKNANLKNPNIIASFLRHILGISIGFSYTLGMVMYFITLNQGMGTQHFNTLMEFLIEYHRFGISQSAKFSYCIIGVMILFDVTFSLIRKDKRSLHDMWSKTQTIFSL